MGTQAVGSNELTLGGYFPENLQNHFCFYFLENFLKAGFENSQQLQIRELPYASSSRLKKLFQTLPRTVFQTN